MASAVLAGKCPPLDGPVLRASSMAAKGLPSASCTMRAATSAGSERAAASATSWCASSSASGARSRACMTPAPPSRASPRARAEPAAGVRVASTTHSGGPALTRCISTSTSASATRCASSTCSMTWPPPEAANSKRRKAPIIWWRLTGPGKASAGAAKGLSKASTERAGVPTVSSSSGVLRIKLSASAAITAWVCPGCTAPTRSTHQPRARARVSSSRHRAVLPMPAGPRKTIPAGRSRASSANHAASCARASARPT